MYLLVRSIQRTADIAGGYTVGTLVIDGGVFIQKENGQMVEGAGHQVEVKNGDQWQTLALEDYKVVTVEGYPGYAGLDARMM